MNWIDNPDQLDQLVKKIGTHTIIGLDTEFERSRTFYAQLALLQIGFDDECYLIDPLALNDLGPIYQVLEDSSIVKIMHCPGEDMTIFHAAGVKMQNLFDTQVAATLTGADLSVGYQALVESELGIELDKGSQRSNWLKRPLSEKQKRYACADVAHLPELHQRLQARLAQMERTAWAREEFRSLLAVDNIEPAPARFAAALPVSHRLNARQELVFRALAEWREQIARNKDLPRTWVLSKAELASLAEHLPTSSQQLHQIKPVKSATVKRYGEEILDIIAGTQPEPHHDSGPPADTILARVDAMRSQVRALARRLDLPAGFIGSKRNLQAIAQEHEPDLDEHLGQWRQHHLGDAFSKILAQ